MHEAHVGVDAEPSLLHVAESIPVESNVCCQGGKRQEERKKKAFQSEIAQVELNTLLSLLVLTITHLQKAKVC